MSTSTSDIKYIDGLRIKDCIGCGFCCTKAKCSAGNRLYAAADVCTALEWNGERHVCKLMELPGIIGERYRKELYAGEGCCAGINSWRTEKLQNRIKRTTCVDNAKNAVPGIMQKFLAALGKQMISGDVIHLTTMHFVHELQKDGICEQDAIAIGNRCIEYIRSNRSSFNTDFMG